MRARSVRSLLLAAAAMAASAPALSQGYDPPGSLDWPLFNQFDPSVARQALGSSFGEYQKYDTHYLHTGIDIRGQAGDIVRIVADGNVWVTAHVDTDGCTDNSQCRLYVKGSDDYIYYYSHLALGPEAEEMTSEVREKIVNATHWNPAGGSFPVQPDTNVSAGQILSEIGQFGGGAGWHHLHFSIIDSTENYDAIHPLTALKRTGFGPAIVDDEPPVISNLRLFVDGSVTEVSVPDACTPVDGSLDIAATMSDTFFTTDPSPDPVSGAAVWSNGVYEAEYRIRNVATNALISGTWYRFDRAPLRCAGPNRGNACPVSLGATGFFEESFQQSSGGLNMGEPYADVLFAASLSQSNYSGTETYVHLLTHEWGEPGAWNTAASGNGWYQISAVASDADGNQTALSRFVAVNNGGDAMLPADAYVRDNPVDVGAIPSTLGGQPFWRSPDIFIVPQGTPVAEDDMPPNTLLEAGTTYDVYIRVHNDSCETVNGVKAQVYSANPAMIVDDSQWVWITPEDAWVPMVNVDVAPGEVELLGPFEWTPSAAEAGSNEGHRCMLAKIDASDDPFGSGNVANNNNYAQRNLQFELTSFSFNNPSQKDAKIETELACNGFPISLKGASVELRVAYHPALFQAWAGAPGTSVTLVGSTIVVRFTQCNVKLPPVGLAGSTSLEASFDAILPQGTPGKYVLDLAQRVNGVIGGGMSFESRTQ